MMDAMKRRIVSGSLLLVGLLARAPLAGCGDDSTTSNAAQIGQGGQGGGQSGTGGFSGTMTSSGSSGSAGQTIVTTPGDASSDAAVPSGTDSGTAPDAPT